MQVQGYVLSPNKARERLGSHGEAMGLAGMPDALII